MRLAISHSTSYRYEPATSGVIQVLRLTPRNHDGQYVAQWRIDVSTDARLYLHEDEFGNVTHVMTQGVIEDLVINVEGLIETHDTGGVLRGTIERFPPGLFLRPTPLTTGDAPMKEFARGVRADTQGTLEFLDLLMNRLGAHMSVATDPAAVATSAAEAFALKCGVCQDHAHAFIGCARLGGVPARFVSGHFLRGPGALEQHEGHAWAEAFVPDLGWVGFDPAHGTRTTEAHARVAIGLDYLGAAPVRGTRYGGGAETLTVSIRVDQAGRREQSQAQQ